MEKNLPVNLVAPKPPRGRGRPVDPTKRIVIVEAARALFFQGGPDGLSMEAVAREAGVSKATVYAYFANRDDLIRCVIKAQRERMAAPLSGSIDDAVGLRRALTSFGLALLRFLTSEDFLLLKRMLAAHCHADPALGRLIYEHGPQANLRELAGLIDRLQARGLVCVGNSMVAAEQLIGMWVGTLRERLAMTNGEQPDPGELERRVKEGVDTFSRAFASTEKAHASRRETKTLSAVRAKATSGRKFAEAPRQSSRKGIAS